MSEEGKVFDCGIVKVFIGVDEVRSIGSDEMRVVSSLVSEGKHQAIETIAKEMGVISCWFHGQGEADAVFGNISPKNLGFVISTIAKTLEVEKTNISPNARAGFEALKKFQGELATKEKGASV